MKTRYRNRGPFPWRIHPIWRGIGCLLLILVPLISYGLINAFLDLAPVQYPELASSLARANPGGLDSPTWIVALVIVLSMVFFLVLSIVGSLLYSLFGGPKTEEMASQIRRDPYRR